MGAKLDIYNLGEQGINVAKSPIHLADGELVHAQNAEFFIEQGRGALRKRPGLQVHNTTALAGRVNGMIGVPLPAPGSGSLRINGFQGTVNPDGTVTWTPDTGPDRLFGTIAPMFWAEAWWTELGTNAADVPIGFSVPKKTPLVQPIVTIGGVTYYAGPNLSIAAHTEGSEYEVLRVPPANPAAPERDALGPLLNANGKLYYAQRLRPADDTYAIRVYEYNPTTNINRQVGPDLPSPPVVIPSPTYAYPFLPTALALWQNRLFLGTAQAINQDDTGNDHGFAIFTIPLNGTAWTKDIEEPHDDRTIVATSFAPFGGHLFAGSSGNEVSNAILFMRPPSGPWSTYLGHVGTSWGGWFDGLINFDNSLYFVGDEPANPGVTDIQKIAAFGDTPTIDYDLTTAPAKWLGGAKVSGDTLYYLFFDPNTHQQRLVYKKKGGTWKTSAIPNPTDGKSLYLGLT